MADRFLYKAAGIVTVMGIIMLGVCGKQPEPDNVQEITEIRLEQSVK